VGPEPDSRCSTGLKMAALFFPDTSVTVTSQHGTPLVNMAHL